MVESGVNKSQGWATNAFANQVLLPLAQCQHLQFLSVSRCHVALLDITSNISAGNQNQKEGRIFFYLHLNRLKYFLIFQIFEILQQSTTNK